MAKDSTTVRFDNVQVRYADSAFPICYDFDVRGGEFFGVLGESGSGKSTLLSVCAGLIRPKRRAWAFAIESSAYHSGRVFFNGIDVSHHEPGRRRIGMVSQKDNLYPHLSVKENLQLVSSCPLSATRAQQLIESLRIGALLERSPRTLSGGETQRIALAKALLIDANIILLDEPCSSLDPLHKADLTSLLRSAHGSQNRTFTLVSHDQDAILSLCSRVAFIDRGKIVQIGSPEHLLSRPSTSRVCQAIDPFFRQTLPLRSRELNESASLPGLQGPPIPTRTALAILNGRQLSLNSSNGRWRLKGTIDHSFHLSGQRIASARLPSFGVSTNVPVRDGEAVPREATIAIGEGGLFFFDKDGNRLDG